MIGFPANGTEASDRLQNSVSNQPRQTQWFKQLPPFSLEIAREWFNPNVDPNHHVWPRRLKFKHQCFFQGAWNPYPYLLFQTPSYASFVDFILAKYNTALQKHPGGWETALAVEHFLKRNSSGAVAPYTFYDEHYLKFSRGKLNDFEGMSWYLQGFVVVAAWKPFPCSSLACHFSKRLLRARPVRLRKSVEIPWCHRHWQILIPWSNSGFTAPSLRVLQEDDTAPLEIFHIPSMPPVCTSKFPHSSFLVMQKMPLLWLQASWSRLCSEVSLG